MRVGVFLYLESATAGGGYRFQDDVFTAFLDAAPESRHAFVVFCNPAFAEFIVGRLASNVTVQPYTEPQATSRWLRRLRILRRYAPDPETLTHHAAKLGVDYMWFVTAPGQVIDLPYVTVVWDLQHRSHPWFPEVSAAGQWDHREAVYNRVLKRAAAVIVGTETGKREVNAFYGVPFDRITVLPHPTPEFALKAADGDVGVSVNGKYGLSSPFVFYPAQFWGHKNHVNLLLAVDILRTRFNLAVQVAFVGSDQGNQAHVEAWIRKLNLTNQVRILGFLPQQDLVALYRSCLALTYVSFCGPENLPPLEAFALGCPVIAADIPGAREQLGDAAILVRPDDPEGIAGAIKELINSPTKRQQLIGRGKVRSTQFRSRDFVRGVFSLLDGFEASRRAWGPSE